jgi:hypothetical protein
MVNGVLANEKRQRDLEMHQEWAKLEAREIEYTNNTDFMTENPATEVSMLAPHRVKPYHFKGFNQERIDQVNLERSQQIKEQEWMKKQRIEEEKLYAQQQEAIRR